MNFGQAFLFLFACATLGVVEGEGGTRGLATSIHKNDQFTSGFGEKLGACETGAVCGLWGDPHVVTCDGFGYDCNRFGVFTLMDNFLWNIQGNFVQVRPQDLKNVIRHTKVPRATFATTLGVEIPEREGSIPAFQFSFPERIESESEHNCVPNFEWYPKLVVDDDVYAGSIKECNTFCHLYDGCSKFNYKKSSNQCHFAGEDAKLVSSNSGDVISGHVDRCGTGYEDRGEIHPYAMSYGNGVRYNQEDKCSILYYEDGVMQNITGKSTPADGVGDFLYGNETSDVYVQLYNLNKIKIVAQTLKGSTSEIMIEVAGQGPGKKFSCHWNIWVCLPVEEKDDFATSVGLLGSPDGNKTNDWTTRDGTIVVQENPKKDGGFNYCKDWCVTQKETFLQPPVGATFDDMKCHGEDYVDIDDDSCEYNKTAQDETCGSIENQNMQDDCKFECCMGNCANDTVLEIIVDILKFDEPVEEAVVDLCDDQNESVCLSSIVEVLRNNQENLEPPTIYDIEFLESDDKLGKQVTFKVSHSLYDDTVDMYVRHQKKVGEYANDPVCDKELNVKPGCTETLLTAGCVEHNGDFASYAIVDVYLASSSSLVIDAGSEVQKCCHPAVYDDDVNIAKYTYKIQCQCPNDTTA
jgi:hypothetical protein